MSDTTQAPVSRNAARAPLRTVLLALLADVLIIVVFAVYGRASHGMSLQFAEFFRVAWPFLAGLVIAWAVSAAWRRPLAPLRSGIPITLITVAAGMVLRYGVVQQGAAPVSWAFVLVSTGLFAVLFIGWRGIAALVRRRRAR